MSIQSSLNSMLNSIRSGVYAYSGVKQSKEKQAQETKYKEQRIEIAQKNAETKAAEEARKKETADIRNKKNQTHIQLEEEKLKGQKIKNQQARYDLKMQKKRDAEAKAQSTVEDVILTANEQKKSMEERTAELEDFWKNYGRDYY